jgi:mannan endo-1,4-beta-mannosidase
VTRSTGRRRTRARLATLAPLAALLVAACSGRGGAPEATAGGAPAPAARIAPLVDGQATRETRALFGNLRRLAGTRVLFGHQDDLAYGHRWRAEPGRSDVRESAGAYPAVYGWELGDLERGRDRDLDGVPFADMRRWIVEGYRRGGVVTLSWHMGNPVSGGSAWDTTRAVAAVLPGGARHAEYRAWLDRFADFVGSLRAPDREGAGTHLVPVVFRPFHEMSGSWFWWGARHRSAEEYRALWRFTVEHLRDRRGVHNLLYAYAPDVVDDAAAYLASYPGDAYVDVLGVDDYQSVRAPALRDTLVRRLRLVVTLAESRGKVAAFTETGVEGVPDSTFWTGTLLPALTADTLTRRVAWLMVWRNAPATAQQPRHFYAPHAGHPSVRDFVRFREHPLIAFDGEFPDLYRDPPHARAPRAPGDR